MVILLRRLKLIAVQKCSTKKPVMLIISYVLALYFHNVNIVKYIKGIIYKGINYFYHSLIQGGLTNSGIDNWKNTPLFNNFSLPKGKRVQKENTKNMKRYVFYNCFSTQEVIFYYI